NVVRKPFRSRLFVRLLATRWETHITLSSRTERVFRGAREVAHPRAECFNGGMTLLVSRTSNWLPLLCMAPFFAWSAGSGPGGGGGASNGDGDGDGDGDVGGDGDGDGDGDINIQPGTG